jgi:hypothetical protein
MSSERNTKGSENKWGRWYRHTNKVGQYKCANVDDTNIVVVVILHILTLLRHARGRESRRSASLRRLSSLASHSS